jgi:hypothetical protein
LPSHQYRRAGGLGSQRGAIGVGTVILVALGAAFVYLLLGASEGDSDHFGSAPVPSTSRVELPEGDTDVYYFEATATDSSLPFEVPADLRFTVIGPGGEAVRVDSRGGEVEEVEGGSTKVVGSVLAPEEGTYEVRVTSNEAAARPSPQLTFGQSPFQAVQSRGEDLVEELKGPPGIALLAILVGLMFLPALRRALRRD